MLYAIFGITKAEIAVMTWAVFKAKLEEMGVKDTDEIEYIDVGCLVDALTVRRHVVNGVAYLAVID